MATINTTSYAGDGSYQPPWLKLIWESNKISKASGHERMFGEPIYLGKPGGFGLAAPWPYVEEYGEARVFLNHDANQAAVVSKTDFGHDVLTQAAEKLGLEVDP